MYDSVWKGNNVPTSKRVLILGESHYKDESSIGTVNNEI